MKTSTRNARRFRTSIAAAAALTLGSAALACDPADHNRSGHVGLEDLSSFLTAYFAGDKSADVNQDGLVGVGDLFDFVSLWVPAYINAGAIDNTRPAKPTDTIAPSTPDQLGPTPIPTDDRAL